MENEYGIGTILNSYTYTLPTGNTISVNAPNDFLASLKAGDQFRKSQAQGNFTNLTAFFESMPRLRHKTKVKNPKTGVESEITFSGLQDFFGLASPTIA